MAARAASCGEAYSNCRLTVTGELAHGPLNLPPAAQQECKPRLKRGSSFATEGGPKEALYGAGCPASFL